MRRLLLLLLSLLFQIQVISQEQVQELNFSYSVSELTAERLTEKYTENEILNFPNDKLAFFDYLMSGSFEIVPNQNYSQVDFLKIDTELLQTMRNVDSRVTVTDPTSGIQLELFSLNEIEQKRFDLTGVSYSNNQSKLKE